MTSFSPPPCLSAPLFTKPPVLIGGCGRSGSSLLLSILSAHPDIQAISVETEAFCPGIWEGSYDPERPFDWERLAGALAAEPEKETACRWCEKSPKNIIALPTILQRLKDEVRFLNIVRDGRDVITSRHPTRRRDRFWVLPQRWLQDVSAGKPFDLHPQVLVVKYEDLTLDFKASIKDICAFLQIELTPEILDWHKHATVRKHVAWSGEIRPMSSQSIGRWRHEKYKPLIEGFLEMPGAIDLLRHYGYET